MQRHRKVKTMKILQSKVTQRYHVRMADGTVSKGFDSKKELMATLKKLQRNERRYTADQARRDCGLVKTAYGWE